MKKCGRVFEVSVGKCEGVMGEGEVWGVGEGKE